MKTVEHLTKEQIQAYAADSLAQIESSAIEKHLLQCAACRDTLPPPTPEQFWSVLLDDEPEREEIYATENLSPVQSPFSTVFSFFRQPMAWGGTALILIAGISFLIWLGATRQPNSETEVSQTIDAPKTIENAKTETKPPSDEKSPVAVDDESQKDNSQGNSQQSLSPKQPEDNLPVVAEKPKTPGKIEGRELAGLLKNTPPAVSSLRPNQEMILRGSGGDKKNSASTAAFALLSPVGETVLEPAPEFRWQQAANAKSYRISIFDADFNEVLTTEVPGNSYKLDKLLKLGAKYLWRVVAQTDNGEIVAPKPPQPPAVFRIAAANTESRIAALKKDETDRLKLAVFYAHEGMLDSAACTLKEILAKNPKHAAARRLLAKVEQWKKENNATVQRCGPSTATKADQ